MKRYGNLYHKITDIENIKLAHKNASRGKKHYDEVKMVDSDVDKYCQEIKYLLESKTFKNSEYDVFEKNDKGKIRKIYKLPYYPDRIIHHAIMQVVEPIWKKSLINNTYQSIKGRGIHKAKRDIEKAINKYKPTYVLKIDIRKFYPSVTNEVAKDAVRWKIKCKDTLWLLDEVICSLEELPIGNYISQYLGNIVLAKVDHQIWRKVPHGMYYRYCDDIVAVAKSKRLLHTILANLKLECGKLVLDLKNNYQVFKLTDNRGIDFVGFVFRVYDVKLRRNIAWAVIREDREKQLCSYFGWVKEAEAKGLWYGHGKLNDRRMKW